MCPFPDIHDLKLILTSLLEARGAEIKPTLVSICVVIRVYEELIRQVGHPVGM
jgi:hypothetical protein